MELVLEASCRSAYLQGPASLVPPVGLARGTVPLPVGALPQGLG